MKNKGISLVALFYFLFFGWPVAGQETEIVIEYICSVILEYENGTFSIQSSNGFSVLADTQLDKPFHIPTKVNLRAFICSRSSFIPQPNDYKVMLGGYALGLTDVQENDSDSTSVLYDYVEGKFVYTVEQGELSEKEAREIRKRLLEFQTKYGAF